MVLGVIIKRLLFNPQRGDIGFCAAGRFFLGRHRQGGEGRGGIAFPHGVQQLCDDGPGLARQGACGFLRLGR